MKIFAEIGRTPEFEKDLKKPLKRFCTLEKDLQTFFQTQLTIYHKLNIANRGILRLKELGTDVPKIFKAKKFACRSLPGKGVQSGIRVIYAYYEDVDKIELIEIYYKGDKESEDRGRTKRYLDGFHDIKRYKEMIGYKT